MTLSRAEVSLSFFGQQHDLTATVRDQNGVTMTGVAATWTSSAVSVTQVSQEGVVTAVGNGVARVVAAVGSVADTSMVTVEQIADSISLSPDSVLLVGVADTISLVASVLDAGGSDLVNPKVTWSSDDTGVATVDGSGLVSTVFPGNATVAAASGSALGTARVIVEPLPPSSVRIEPIPISVWVGEPEALSAVPLDDAGNPIPGHSPASWSTSDVDVVSVDPAAGTLIGLQPGAATVEATIGETTGSAAVTVSLAPVAEVQVSPSSAAMLVGQERQFRATPVNDAGQPVFGHTPTWSSNDPGIAEVDPSSGLVTGVTIGTATISVTVQDKTTSVDLDVEQGTPIEGRVVDLFGDPISSLQFIVQSEAFSDSVVISASGDFSLSTPSTFGTDSVDLIVDLIGDGPRRHLPSLLRIGGTPAPQTTWLTPPNPPDTLIRNLALALVPTDWTIAEGEYAGEVVPVPLWEAYDRSGGGGIPSLYPQGPEGWDIAAAWLQHDLPIPVVLDRSGSTESVEAADSLALWTILDRMEELWGEDLFEPAQFVPWDTQTGPVPLQIEVVFDAGSTPHADFRWQRHSFPSIGDAPAFSTPVQIYWAKVVLPSTDFLNSAVRTVMHEFEHTLGIHHTCTFPSVMGGGPCASATEPTPKDVAYEQVKRAVATLRWSTPQEVYSGLPQIHFGREQARIGERVRMLGRPPYDLGAVPMHFSQVDGGAIGPPAPALPRVERVERRSTLIGDMVFGLSTIRH